MMSGFYSCLYCYRCCFIAPCSKYNSDRLLPSFFNLTAFGLDYGRQDDHLLFVHRFALSWLVKHLSFWLSDSGFWAARLDFAII